MIDIKRSATTILSVEVDDSSVSHRVLNGDDIITLSFTLDSFTEILIGDYIVFNSKNYTVNQAPNFVKVSEVQYQYDITFEGPQYDAGSAMYLLFGEAEFFLTGTAEDFIDLVVDNVNRVVGAGTWSTGTVETTEYKTLHFDSQNCLGVIQKICDEFSLEYEITSDLFINLSLSIGNATGLSYEYHAGLRNISRSKVGGKDIITRLYAYGSARNIDYNYGAKRLKLTDPGYVENNVSSYGVIEAAKIFDDIWPHFTGTVESVPQLDSIIDTSIDFDLNDYLIEGETAKIVFLTGNLAGRTFEISSYVDVTNRVTFKQYTDQDGLTLPDSNPGQSPEIGDTYTFVDIQMPAAYITAAETELLAKAVAYINEMSNPNVIYDIEVDWRTLKAAGTLLDVGDLVEITDTDLTDGAVSFRILDITQNLNNPWKYQVKVGESILISYFQKVAADTKKVSTQVVTLNDDQIKRTRRAIQNITELQSLIFDPDGYFDPDNIRPLSIETGMLTVGFKGAQMTITGVEFTVSPGGDNTKMSWLGGQLHHYTISESGTVSWNISAGSILTLVSGTAYYIYARCEKATSTATIYVSSLQMDTDPGGTYYYFLIGVLHSSIDGERGLSLTYGLTSVTGRLIKTGKISSLDGTTYFDLDDNKIVMSAGSAGGFTVTSDKLEFLSGTIGAGSGGRRTTVSNNATDEGFEYVRDFNVSANTDGLYVRMGKLHNLHNDTWSSEYGFEILKLDWYGYGYNRLHLMRISESLALIAGWKIDYDAIYVGTKKTSDGYASAGSFTLASNGSLHAENFYINDDGSIAARNLTIESIADTGTYGGSIKISSNNLYEPYKSTDYGTININMIGYNGGTTKRRRLMIGDGSNGYMMQFFGYYTGYPNNSLIVVNSMMKANRPIQMSINTTNPGIWGATYTIDPEETQFLVIVSGTTTVNMPSTARYNGVPIFIKNATTGNIRLDGNGKNIVQTGGEYTYITLGSRDGIIIFFSYDEDKWMIVASH